MINSNPCYFIPVRDMTKTYSQMHRTDKYSQFR